MKNSYDEELITFYESENDLFVIQEYMNLDQREVKVYLPSAYDKSLDL